MIYYVLRGTLNSTHSLTHLEDQHYSYAVNTAINLSWVVVLHACHSAGNVRMSYTAAGSVSYLCHVDSRLRHNHRACTHHRWYAGSRHNRHVHIRHGHRHVGIRHAVLLACQRYHQRHCLQAHRMSGHPDPSSVTSAPIPSLVLSRWQMILQPQCTSDWSEQKQNRFWAPHSTVTFLTHRVQLTRVHTLPGHFVTLTCNLLTPKPNQFICIPRCTTTKVWWKCLCKKNHHRSTEDG